MSSFLTTKINGRKFFLSSLFIITFLCIQRLVHLWAVSWCHADSSMNSVGLAMFILNLMGTLFILVGGLVGTLMWVGIVSWLRWVTSD